MRVCAVCFVFQRLCVSEVLSVKFTFRKLELVQSTITMDEAEFQRLLQLFPSVRSRDHTEEESSSKQLASGSGSQSAQEELNEWHDAWNEKDKDFENQGINKNDSFWSKLKSEAAKKVGTEEAEKFCLAFQQIHKRLVNEELSLDVARNLLNSS